MARIVVADDDQDVREVLALQLRGLGHEVTEADTGHSALMAITESRPDLVLCDLQMPDGDGWWVLDSIQTARPDDPIPVIMITGDPAPDLERKALKLGAEALFRKPWMMAELRDAVSRSLEFRSPSTRSNVG